MDGRSPVDKEEFGLMLAAFVTSRRSVTAATIDEMDAVAEHGSASGGTSKDKPGEACRERPILMRSLTAEQAATLRPDPQ